METVACGCVGNGVFGGNMCGGGVQKGSGAISSGFGFGCLGSGSGVFVVQQQERSHC